jgi:hypothetical protein
MKRDPMSASGSRDEIAADLEDQVTGWMQRGNDTLSDEAEAALEALRDGADEVRVGHTVYRVGGSGDSEAA